MPTASLTTATSLFSGAKSAIDSIRLNAVVRERRDGRAVWLKTRRPHSEHVARVANLFFRLAGNPVRVWADASAWQRWEIGCFELLHGETFHATAEGPRGVRLDHLSGVNLCEELERGNLTGAMLEAAARELARAHSLRLSPRDERWSHGDARLANFLFDRVENRARLIDFDASHVATLSAAARHADDLLIFLQDLMGRLPDARWPGDALRFVRSYGGGEAIDALKQRLAVPRFGFARLWWAIRTRYTPRVRLVERAQSLRDALP